MRNYNLLIIVLICLLSSCNKIELSQSELNKLQHVGKAKTFEIDRTEQVFTLKIYDLNIEKEERLNKSRGFAVEFYKILYDRYDSFDMRSTFRIFMVSEGEVDSFDYTFNDVVFFSGLTINAGALFRWFGNGGELHPELVYQPDCFSMKNQLVETNTGWRKNEVEFLYLIGIEKTIMDICEENIEGFILHYYHVGLERTVMVFLTEEGQVAGLVSASV